ncbi:hypothetical protein C8Q72DRAFT_830568 [Fomitopsis betulina]|nr:hypothetical protein C8Q72DRAFT_830568 [Fomitopsis betulina]
MRRCMVSPWRHIESRLPCPGHSPSSRHLDRSRLGRRPATHRTARSAYGRVDSPPSPARTYNAATRATRRGVLRPPPPPPGSGPGASLHQSCSPLACPRTGISPRSTTARSQALSTSSLAPAPTPTLHRNPVVAEAKSRVGCLHPEFNHATVGMEQNALDRVDTHWIFSLDGPTRKPHPTPPQLPPVVEDVRIARAGPRRHRTGEAICSFTADHMRSVMGVGPKQRHCSAGAPPQSRSPLLPR